LHREYIRTWTLVDNAIFCFTLYSYYLIELEYLHFIFYNNILSVLSIILLFYYGNSSTYTLLSHCVNIAVLLDRGLYIYYLCSWWSLKRTCLHKHFVQHLDDIYGRSLVPPGESNPITSAYIHDIYYRRPWSFIPLGHREVLNQVIDNIHFNKLGLLKKKICVWWSTWKICDGIRASGNFVYKSNMSCELCFGLYTKR